MLSLFNQFSVNEHLHCFSSFATIYNHAHTSLHMQAHTRVSCRKWHHWVRRYTNLFILINIAKMPFRVSRLTLPLEFMGISVSLQPSAHLYTWVFASLIDFFRASQYFFIWIFLIMRKVGSFHMFYKHLYFFNLWVVFSYPLLIFLLVFSLLTYLYNVKILALLCWAADILSQFSFIFHVHRFACLFVWHIQALNIFFFYF